MFPEQSVLLASFKQNCIAKTAALSLLEENYSCWWEKVGSLGNARAFAVQSLLSMVPPEGLCVKCREAGMALLRKVFFRPLMKNTERKRINQLG